MNPILESWSTLQPPALALVAETAAKGTVLLALAALIAWTLRGRSAAVRHLVWGVALGSFLALPALLAWMPAWRIEVPLAASAPAAALAPAPPSDPPAAGPDAGAAAVARTAVTLPPAADAPAGPRRGAATAAPPRQPLHPLFALWLAGALGVLGLFVAGHVVLRLTTRDARPLREREWQDLSLEAAGRLGLDVPFMLLSSPTASVPVTYGLVRPRVLLPASAEEWTADRRRAVLLHELGHVRRHDCLTQAIAQLACAAFWFHPGVWWAASRLRVERERACDDLVLGVGTRATAYADHLLEVVRSLRATRLAALGAVAFARPSQFEGRLLAVLDPARDRRGVNRRLALPAASFAALALLPIAALELDGVPAGAASRARLDPQGMRASSVIVAPAHGALLERLGWIEAETRGTSGGFWVGWQVASDQPPDGDVLGDTEGLHLGVFDEESGAFTLDDVLEGRRASTWPAPRAERRDVTAFLFHAPRGGAPADRFRLQSRHLPADLGRRPLYWAGTVSDEHSLAVLEGFLERERSLDLRRELVHAVAMHRASARVMPVLDRIIRGDEAAPVRAAAVAGLARHPAPDALGRLTAIARNDRSPQVRRSAVEALGEIGTPQAMDVLMGLARDADAGVRRQAFDALGDQVADDDDEEEMGRGAGIGLGRGSWISAGSGPASVRMYGDITVGPGRARSKEADERIAARDRAAKDRAGTDRDGADDGPAPPADEEATGAGDGDEEESGDDGGGEDDDGGNVPGRVAPFPPSRLDEPGDHHDEVRMQAVESIGRFPEADGRPRLERIAREHDDVNVRVAALEAIARYGSPAAAKTVAEMAWTSPSRHVRMMAVEFVGRFKADLALPMLREVLERHSDRDARRSAIEVLGRFSDARATAMLDGVVGGPYGADAEVAAVEVLGRHRGADVTRRLHRIALEHRNEEVARMAVEVIGRRHEEDGIARLLGDLARSHPRTGVQRQAVESLGRLKGDDILPQLAEIARSHPAGDVRRQAVESMSRRDPERALPYLEQILKVRGSKN